MFAFVEFFFFFFPSSGCFLIFAPCQDCRPRSYIYTFFFFFLSFVRLLLNLRRCLHRARTVGHTLIYIWGVFRCVNLYMWAGYGWLQFQYLESNLSPDHPPDSLERRSGIFVKCTSALDRVLNSRHLRDTSNVLPTTPTRHQGGTEMCDSPKGCPKGRR